MQKTSEGNFDLISTDIMMPRIDGLAVVRRLRQRPGTVAIPIVIFSEKALSTDQILGLEAGADDYIIKPCCPSEYLARVRAVLRRKGRSANPSSPPSEG